MAEEGGGDCLDTKKIVLLAFSDPLNVILM